jgi:small subunit ribosomal protein S17
MKNDGNIRKKEVIGVVVSDKMDKAVTVMWETRKKHPVYKKYINWHKKIKARDEKNEAAVGDRVKIAETRPVSKDITWRVTEIVKKAQRG